MRSTPGSTELISLFVEPGGNMKYGGAQNTRHENTEQKNAAQKCTSGKCETTKMRERQDIERIMFEYRLLFRMTRWTKTYYDENILR